MPRLLKFSHNCTVTPSGNWRNSENTKRYRQAFSRYERWILFHKIQQQTRNWGALVSQRGHLTSTFFLPSVEYCQSILGPALPDSCFCLSIEQFTSVVMLLHMERNNYIFSAAEVCLVKKLKSTDVLCFFFPQSSVQKTTLPPVTILYVRSSRMPHHLTEQ